MAIITPQPEPQTVEEQPTRLTSFAEIRQAFQNIGIKITKRAIQSDNYVAATSGFIIRQNGTAEFVTLASGSFIKTFAQDAIPTSINIGDLWVDTNDNNKVYRAAVAGATTIGAGAWVEVGEDIEWADLLDGSSTKPADNATVGATAGTDLKDSNANILADNDVLNIVRSETAGEALDASSTPIAVYKDTTDGKVYKTDANDSTGGHRRFYGFIADAQNLSTDDTCYVRTQGIVAGFSGLTSGQFLYLSETAGAITHTAPSSTVIRVGIAISATAMWIATITTIKQVTGSVSKACNTSDQTTAVTLGFRPRLIIATSLVRGSDTAACDGEQFVCNGTWSDSSGQTFIGIGDAGTIVKSDTLIASNNDSATQDDIDVDIITPTETGFSIRFVVKDDTNGASASVKYIALGE